MYIKPTQEAGRDFVMRRLSGPVIMLNLLRFRDTADYSASPDLAPDAPISGAEAYARYMKAVEPLLAAKGGSLVFQGDGGAFLIGPTDERWDCVLLVQHRTTQDFLAFADDPDYLAVAGHRTAALADSRLLPMTTG